MRKAVARIAVAAIVAMPLVGSAASSANAISASVQLTLRSSKCTGTISWAGSHNETYLAWPQGTTKLCTYKFQMLDRDRYFDYYMIHTSADYTFTKGNRSFSAPAQTLVSSSRTARGQVFGATKSYVSSTSCSQAVEVGVSAGPFSVAVPIQACKNYSVKRTAATEYGAGWKAEKVGGVGLMEAVYYQKVPQGVTPTFVAEYWVPQYTHYVCGPCSGPQIETKTIKKVLHRM